MQKSGLRNTQGSQPLPKTISLDKLKPTVPKLISAQNAANYRLPPVVDGVKNSPQPTFNR
jgi:hypothetical protein